jgi:hypothetical protein
MKLVSLVFALATLGSFANASCPNACSGHGTCGTNDECTCFRNWVANDCSERVCTYGISHSTTPQGDLNMDGDRFDNTHKAIVYKTGGNAGKKIQAFISHLDNKLVFAHADVAANELNVDDQITIQGYDYVITAVDPDGKTFTLDQDQTHSTTGLSGSVYKKVVTLAAPAGTWESWPGDAVAKSQDEGHFYMECSNQGLCDRGTGLCECFDGYAGRACESTTCPNNCNGKGVCATIAQMAWMKPHASANTVSVARGSHFVSTENMVTDLAAGDRVYLGEQASFDSNNLYTVTRVTAAGTSTTVQGFYVTPRSQVSLPFGSKLYKAATYNLWDANKVSGCVCDAGFSGHDCSARNCQVGHDPLDVKGEDKTNSNSAASTTNPSTYTKRNERQMLSLDSTHGAVSGTFKLTYTSPHGEKLTTGPLSATPMLSSTVRVGAPNAIDDVYCTEANKANYRAPHATSYGANNGFETCFKKVYFTPHLPDTELAVGDYIRVGRDIRYVAVLDRSASTGMYTSATVSEQFTDTYGEGSYAYRQSAAGAIDGALEGLPNKAVGAVSVARSMSSGDAVLKQTNALVYAAVAGTTGVMTITAAARDSLMEGDVVRLHGYRGAMQVDSMVLSATLNTITSVTGSKTAFGPATGSTDTGTVSGSLIGNTAIRDSGFKYRISFDSNAGDVADLVCDASSLRPVYRMSVAGYVTRDAPDRVYFVDVHQGSSQPAYSEVQQSDPSHPEAVSAGDVIYVGEQRCEVIAADDDVDRNQAIVTGIQTYAPAGYSSTSVVCKDALVANAHSTATEIFTHETLEVMLGDESTNCASTDKPALRHIHNKVDDENKGCVDGAACVDVFSYNGEKRLVTYALLDVQPIAAVNTLMDNGDLTVGDRVSVRTETHTYEVRTVDSITTNTANAYFTVSQPFSAAHEMKDIHLEWKGSTGSAVCSGRGICDDGAGDCQCFKGYTGQSCQIQNALAA